MTNIICSWVIPIILNVGLVLFGFWMGNRAGKRKYQYRIDNLRFKVEQAEKDRDWYGDQLPKEYENVPVIYYFKSKLDQTLEEMLDQTLEEMAEYNTQWGLVAAAQQMSPESQLIYRGKSIWETLHNFEDIEHIEIKNYEQFCRTIALAIRDHGIKIDDKAKTIRVYKENESQPKVIDNGVEFECKYKKDQVKMEAKK